MYHIAFYDKNCHSFCLREGDMDRPSFWIAWGIICLVLTGIIGTIINNYGAAFFVSITIIVLICAIWIFVDREKNRAFGNRGKKEDSKQVFIGI